MTPFDALDYILAELSEKTADLPTKYEAGSWYTLEEEERRAIWDNRTVVINLFLKSVSNDRENAVDNLAVASIADNGETFWGNFQDRYFAALVKNQANEMKKVKLTLVKNPNEPEPREVERRLVPLDTIDES